MLKNSNSPVRSFTTKCQRFTFAIRNSIEADRDVYDLIDYYVKFDNS